MAQNIRIDKNVRLVWRGPQVEAEIRLELARRLTTAVRLVADKVKQNIDTPVFPRSKPGEYPRRETGNLQHSVRSYTTPIGLNLVGVVATDVPYGWYLEKSLKREFLSRTLKEQSRAILRVIARRKII